MSVSLNIFLVNIRYKRHYRIIHFRNLKLSLANTFGQCAAWQSSKIKTDWPFTIHIIMKYYPNGKVLSAEDWICVTTHSIRTFKLEHIIFMNTWMKAFSLIVSAPLSSIACNGSSTASIPSILCSPKYILLASSRASCHISCHKIATRISSFDTSCAWWNNVVLECYTSFIRRTTVNEANLINETSTVLADLINNLLCCTLSQYTYWFAGN